MDQILSSERSKSTINTQLIQKLLYRDTIETIRKGFQFYQKNVINDPHIYNEGRIHMIKDTIKKLPSLIQITDINNYTTLIPSVVYMQNQFPGSVHMTMWLVCLQLMASEEQYKQYYQKSLKGQVIGCYAQTQLGHGSDVQSLETTATLDKTTDQFIINTPTISATKFWPGDLGIFANYSVVYAKVIVDGNSLGVFPIIARIRDDNHQPMPGVSCGDIGPKVGYITKDNGYLSFNNVRVPRTNFLSKLIDVTSTGQLQMKGDPKILYASMMIVRKLIITVFPKLYSNGLTIATRYSLFRRMFKNDQGEEIRIIQYQTQQDKILPLIADYYAFLIDGNSIADLTEQNFEKVTKKGDGSLMAECHACLCYSKAYYTDEIERGFEILRRACGGHGFSHYSGLPNLVQQFYAHPIHQGQNTVLYLQTSRYIIKNYNKLIEKGKSYQKKLTASIDYLKDYQTHGKYKSTGRFENQDLLNIMCHNICYLINLINERQKQFKQADSSLKTKDINNYKNGIVLVELAKAHSLFNTFRSFYNQSKTLSDTNSKAVVLKLCKLFGIHHLLYDSTILLQSGCLSRSDISVLKKSKEELLKELRKEIIGLVDSFVISETGLKSTLTYGDVYKNMFELAKKNPLNKEISEGVWTIKKGLTNVRPRL